MRGGDFDIGGEAPNPRSNPDIINSGHSGYHDTISIFRLIVVKAHLRELSDDLPRIEARRVVVTDLVPQRDLFRDYYSFDVVRSVEARRTCMPPI